MQYIYIIYTHHLHIYEIFVYNIYICVYIDIKVCILSTLLITYLIQYILHQNLLHSRQKRPLLFIFLKT